MNGIEFDCTATCINMYFSMHMKKLLNDVNNIQ